MKRRTRYLLLILAVLLLCAGVGAGGVAWWAQRHFDSPGPLAAERTVTIPRGVGLRDIAALLSRDGIIVHPWVFVAGTRFYADNRPLRFGEYVIAARASPRQVMEQLIGGKTAVHRLTVPEGLTTAEILTLIAATDGLTGDVPDVEGEGLLLPETYHFSKDDERSGIVDRMRQAMADGIAELWAGRAPDLPFDTPEEAVILASIVEKETGRADERARVAAVFVNRLRRGMRLQSDPTVAYGLTNGAGPLGRPLTKSDLRSPHPYNTYVIDGMPPGPIANPGRAALQAVMQPAKTRELYFVADGTGGHAFATNLAEHNRNVAKWRRIERARAKEDGS